MCYIWKIPPRVTYWITVRFGLTTDSSPYLGEIMKNLKTVIENKQSLQYELEKMAYFGKAYDLLENVLQIIRNQF